MLGIERREDILTFLKQNKSATVSQLAKKLYIGEATIRRDLTELEEQGQIKRTYGGAVLVEGLATEIPLYVREIENKEAKDVIGALAANFIKDGEIVILDSSSTTYSMVKYLSQKKDCTFITNGAKTAIALGESLHTKIFSTGGRLREYSLSYVGDTAKEFLENFNVDKVFFSCRALTEQMELLDSSIEEAELRKVMLKRSKKAILLCDDSKLQANAFYKICFLSNVHAIIVNQPLPSLYQEYAKRQNIEVIYP